MLRQVAISQRLAVLPFVRGIHARAIPHGSPPRRAPAPADSYSSSASSSGPSTSTSWDPRYAEGYGGPKVEPQPFDNDPIAAAFRSGYDAVSTSTAFLVTALADLLQSVAHPAAPRAAIENSVKGGMLLLGLVLLQSVLSLVLTVGALALTLYTLTQVFGVRLPLPLGGSGDDEWRGGGGRPFPPPGQPQDPRSARRYRHSAAGFYDKYTGRWTTAAATAMPGAAGVAGAQQGAAGGAAGAAAGGAAGGAGYWQQQQRGQQQRPGAGAAAGSKSDVVDVYFDS